LRPEVSPLLGRRASGGRAAALIDAPSSRSARLLHSSCSLPAGHRRRRLVAGRPYLRDH